MQTNQHRQGDQDAQAVKLTVMSQALHAWGAFFRSSMIALLQALQQGVQNKSPGGFFGLGLLVTHAQDHLGQMIGFDTDGLLITSNAPVGVPLEELTCSGLSRL